MDGHIHIKPNEGYHIIPRHLVWRGKCKYTYMNFTLYKQVVLSEETVFNEGEGDTDPQALPPRDPPFKKFA
jgi:hypothetical protein